MKYIGDTARNLKKRLYEHKLDIRLSNYCDNDAQQIHESYDPVTW